jgi:hypothetical protein
MTIPFMFVALIFILGSIYTEVRKLRRMLELEHISEKITSKPSL